MTQIINLQNTPAPNNIVTESVSFDSNGIDTVETGPRATIPGIIPGADILLATRGATRTQRALTHLDDLERSACGLLNVSAAYWRHLHNRLAVSMDPHAYSPLQASILQGDFT